MPIHSTRRQLLAEATVDGIDGLFGIDTGDMYSLSLYAPFVRSTNLWSITARKFKAMPAKDTADADQDSLHAQTRCSWATAEVIRPITVLSTDTLGAESSATVAGNIGLHILRQFNIVFDGPHGKMYLEKNANYGKPDIFNRAGLMLNYDPDI